MKSQVDFFIAFLAAILCIWSLAAAITLHPVFLRWKLAAKIREKYSATGVRLFFLAISGLMAFALYRILYDGN